MPQVNLAASPKVTAVAVVHERFQSSCFLSACRAFVVSNSSCRARLSSSKVPAAQHVTAIQQQRSQLIARASEEQQQVSAFDYEEPETAKEGIDLGLVLCKQGRCAAGGRTSGSCAQQRFTQGRDCTMPAHCAQWAVLTIQSTQWKLVMRRRMNMCASGVGQQQHMCLRPLRHALSCREPNTDTHPSGLHALCRWGDALNIFEKSLKLPGTGVKRFRSAGQEQTAFAWPAWLMQGRRLLVPSVPLGTWCGCPTFVYLGAHVCVGQRQLCTTISLSSGMQAFSTHFAAGFWWHGPWSWRFLCTPASHPACAALGTTP
jgi:hypothetical protein